MNMMVADTGHSVHLEQPELADWIAGFLGSAQPGRWTLRPAGRM